MKRKREKNYSDIIYRKIKMMRYNRFIRTLTPLIFAVVIPAITVSSILGVAMYGLTDSIIMSTFVCLPMLSFAVILFIKLFKRDYALLYDRDDDSLTHQEAILINFKKFKK